MTAISTPSGMSIIDRTRIAFALLAVAAAGTTVTMLTIAGAGSTLGAERATQLVVSALPGTDLSQLEALPGLSATSGPFPSVTTGVRYGRRAADLRLEGRAVLGSVAGGPTLSSGARARSGTLVLDEAVAHAIRAHVGARVTVATASGPATLRLSGIAAAPQGASNFAARAGTGYVTPSTLRRVAPNRRTYASTLYLRLADTRDSAKYVRWIRAQYPAHQATVVLSHAFK
jgi:hypothetical protein